MKKILLVLLVLGAITATAEDSYLYWMIGGNASEYTYDTVKVCSVAGGSEQYLTVYNSYGASLGTDVDAEIVDAYSSLNQGLYASMAGVGETASFVIELWNDGGFVAQSHEPLSWSTAMANYVTTYNSMQLPNAWVAQSFAIPEPNSGLLMLIGCAVLGLRRRRQRKV